MGLCVSQLASTLRSHSLLLIHYDKKKNDSIARAKRSSDLLASHDGLIALETMSQSQVFLESL